MRWLKIIVTIILAQLDKIFKTSWAINYRLWLDTRRINREWYQHLLEKDKKIMEAELVRQKAHEHYLWQKTEDSIKKS
jgi:hypothetical protein